MRVRNPVITNDAVDVAVKALAYIAGSEKCDAGIRVSAARELLDRAHEWQPGPDDPGGHPAGPPQVFEGGIDPGPFTTDVPTFNEHGNAMLARIDKLFHDSGMGPLTTEAANDLYEAKLRLEDALTRYNSARYRMAGLWDRRDSDQFVAGRAAGLF